MGKFDLKTNKALPRLDLGGKTLMCLHFDSSTGSLGAIVATKKQTRANSNVSSLDLVNVNTDTGKLTSQFSFQDFPSGLSWFHQDGDAKYPPVCSFSAATGILAFLLVDIAEGNLPAFANKAV